MAYQAITVEGGLFPPDLLDEVAAGRAPGQDPASFGVRGSLSDEMQAAFSDIRAFWDTFQRRLGRQRERDAQEGQTSLTRQALVEPVLERLDYQLVPLRRSLQVGPEGYFISHLAKASPEEPDEAAPPLHVIGFGEAIDRRSATSRRSPYATVQEYLNRSDALWGLVTNGETLRLLRGTERLYKPTYLEVNLRLLVEQNLYSEFVPVYRLLHRSRLPAGDDPAACPLEKLYQTGIEQGGRVREHLRDGVEDALRELGTAFLRHPQSQALRAALERGTLDAAAYYRQLLRLVYRLLFLMVVEERKLLFDPGAENAAMQPLYTRFYSLGRLRDRCERALRDDGQSDLWQGLLQTFRLFREDDDAKRFGLAALNGELFGGQACRDLEGAGCANAALLRALFALSTFKDQGGVRRRVNFAGLDVEELGSVYESLLEYRPHVDGVGGRGGGVSLSLAGEGRGEGETRAPARPQAAPSPSVGARFIAPAPSFELLTGSDRKQTGSYYTPQSLVNELIQSALVPVIEERLAAAALTPALSQRERVAAQEQALLSLRVVDPASGSGHFLLAAARRIGRELAKLRSGEDEPPPPEFRRAVRDVIRACIYAVDMNPLAVDLCKVALWIEGYCTGLPLSFLDQHVRLGNSLIGVFDEAVLEQGIPDDAYTAVTGDDKAAAGYYKKRNKAEREGGPVAGPSNDPMGRRHRARGPSGQHSLDTLLASPAARPDLASEFAALAGLEDASAADVRAKEALFQQLTGPGSAYLDRRRACDLWTAAFFVPLQMPAYEDQSLVPTTDTLRRFLAQPAAAYGPLIGEAERLAGQNRFFHWPLEFPEVFERGGFDVVLGNPPWERIKLQEQEFFAGRDAEIAKAPNKAARDRLIKTLTERRPALASEFEAAKHDSEAWSSFVRGSSRFPLCGRGDVNTYSIFAELDRALLAPAGRAGFIVPTGIATDDTTKDFFRSLMDRRSLVSLNGFENEAFIFPAVHHFTKFCLLTLSGSGKPQAASDFTFFTRHLEQLKQPERHFTLTAADLALLNPNTRTCPIFRSRRDAELAKAIYCRVPALIKEGPPEENPWGVRFLTMFHMSNDSGLFRTNTEQRATSNEGRWPAAPNSVGATHASPSAPALLGPGARHSSPLQSPGRGLVPLYEAKMLHHFDHRYGDYRDQPDGSENTHLPDVPIKRLQDPEYRVTPRYWVPAAEVEKRLAGRWDRGWLLGWRDITNATNERTVIAAVLPRVGVGHTTPLMLPAVNGPCLVAALEANLSSFVFDYCARQKIGGTHLTYGFLNQLPVLPPAAYATPCPWTQGDAAMPGALTPPGSVGARHAVPLREGVRPSEGNAAAPAGTTMPGHADGVTNPPAGSSPGARHAVPLRNWIAPRVLELTYTAWDLQPFAQDLGYDGPPFVWDEARRFLLRCELDAAFFHLYGIGRADAAYITDTFPIVRRKDEAAHGEYRTKRVILELYDAMTRAIETGEPYQTRLDPPPAHPRAAHRTLPPLAGEGRGEVGTHRVAEAGPA